MPTDVNSLDEMHGLGLAVGGKLSRGDILLLNGTLGAGKTSLVQGIGEALGITGVTSPTFVISRTYPGSIPLIHVDAYRLLDGANTNAYLDDLDLDTERESGVTVIEWGGQESARLSDERLEISIDRSDDVRDVSANAIGARWSGFSL